MLYYEVLAKVKGKAGEKYTIGPETKHHCCGGVTSAMN
jgi:hypothetical protein